MLKNALLASALGLSIYALATSASAGHRPQGWYVGVEGGATWLDDAALDTVGLPPVNWEAEFESGWAAFVEVGYRWETNWRMELEAGWRENDADCISFGGACVAGNWGEVQQSTLMLNFVHDIDISERTALSVGIGLGGALIEAGTPFALADDDDFVFAGQAIVQLSHELTNRLDFVLTYRFLTSEEPQFDLFGPGAIEVENENHTVTVGLRFDLQADAEPMAPQPVMSAPPAGPAPAPRQFIVYFGFNKANLNASAMEVVREAAAVARQDGIVQIVVTGHTDTVGSNGYNLRLSNRRAGNVKKALVSEGIPAGAISASGRGETTLMVQTGDREMEARNRRSEINLN
ncbi:MAG: OmpA family protein [Alphaproteobacteria bacterium]|nr:OmpA family protein [Alphaproteobacteria bacterium]